MASKSVSAKNILINVLVTLVAGFIYFYFELPPLNLHSAQFYSFFLFIAVVYCVTAIVTSGIYRQAENGRSFWQLLKQSCFIPLIIIAAVVVIYLVGGLLSSVILRAGAYSELLSLEEGNFTEEIEEISFDQIPMMDKKSAEKLGDRKLGELSDMVSQFEVSDQYTQINYNNRPVRVTPLEYGDIFKWLNNRRQGLPAYLVIDMVTQNVDVVRLPEGMRYSTCEHFGRNLNRHLRFQYPTFMFDEPTFEINDDGTPFWVCSRIVKRIGLFGGTDVEGAVLVNAINGESQYYEEVPNWVDGVYSADLIMEQYDYHGTYQGGFINSIFGQKNVTVTTQGYNYIAMNDDVYVYTGITSVTGDQSNIGFILTNQRTKETRYYEVAGAQEMSAMASAEGVVQHLNYAATFPLLLNVNDQPTYFMALKDNANLVKMYAMVNVEQYQIVATGASVSECKSNYLKLLLEMNVVEDTSIPVGDNTVTGTITDIRSAVIEGNTVYYIEVDGSGPYYSITAAAEPGAVLLNPGDTVRVLYASGEEESGILLATKVTRVPAALPEEPTTDSPAEVPKEPSAAA